MSKDEIVRTAEALVFENPWIRVYYDHVRFADGRTGRYSRLAVGEGGACPGAAIVPITEDGRVLLVEQYRYVAAARLLELPRGFGKAGESAEQTARRELREETAHEGETWEHLGSILADTGLIETPIEIFRVRGVQPTGGDTDGEVARIHHFAESQVDALIAANRLRCGISLAAWALHRARR